MSTHLWGVEGGGLKIRGTFLGPNNKDERVLGSMLGSTYFGKLPVLTAGGAWMVQKANFLEATRRLRTSGFRV